ncbi:MAG TPA: hypothetical protein VES20_02115, partial [Bryobacteraceae bacterium]|nr:hypothetical protein [Bryobacteraceae bacterium]
GTPAIAEGRVYTFGAEGVLHALDVNTGKKLWRVDTHQRFNVQKQFFGAAASPLVRNAVYVNIGGTPGLLPSTSRRAMLYGQLRKTKPVTHLRLRQRSPANT